RPLVEEARVLSQLRRDLRDELRGIARQAREGETGLREGLSFRRHPRVLPLGGVAVAVPDEAVEAPDVIFAAEVVAVTAEDELLVGLAEIRLDPNGADERNGSFPLAVAEKEIRLAEPGEGSHRLIAGEPGAQLRVREPGDRVLGPHPQRAEPRPFGILVVECDYLV